MRRLWTTVERLWCRITLQQNDPRWVGAWWVGFLAVTVSSLIIAPAFFGYPPDPSSSSYFTHFMFFHRIKIFRSIHRVPLACTCVHTIVKCWPISNATTPSQPQNRPFTLDVSASPHNTWLRWPNHVHVPNGTWIGPAVLQGTRSFPIDRQKIDTNRQNALQRL